MMLGARLNFVNFANPAEPYVYVQSSPEIRRLTDPLLALAKQDPSAYHLDGRFMLDSYYPLPWMLGDFTNIAYLKNDAPSGPITAAFVAAEKSKAAAVESMLLEPYYRREFRLRDAQEDCVAWFRVSTFHDLLNGEATVGPAVKSPVP
jgi:hypothetical protein